MKKVIFLIPIFAFFLNALVKFINFPTQTEFYSDAALRFRYAKMFAEEGRLPDLDKKIMHPEGISPWRLIHPTMDAIIGLSYRILRWGNFFSYTRTFIILFSSLSVVIFYFFSRYLFKRNLTVAVTSFLYAVGPAGYWRVIGNYLREEIALPFLFLGYFLLFKAYGTKNRWIWLLAGVSFCFSLTIWHMAQFFFGLVIIFLTGYGMLHSKSKIEWHNILFFSIPSFLISVIWPPLFLKHFFISPQMLLLYGLIFYLILLERFGRRWRCLIVYLVFLGFGVAISKVVGYTREYGHVFMTILYKIYYLLQKPSDPTLLVEDARLIWMGPFATPGLFSFLFTKIEKANLGKKK